MEDDDIGAHSVADLDAMLADIVRRAIGVKLPDVGDFALRELQKMAAVVGQHGVPKAAVLAAIMRLVVRLSNPADKLSEDTYAARAVADQAQEFLLRALQGRLSPAEFEALATPDTIAFLKARARKLVTIASPRTVLAIMDGLLKGWQAFPTAATLRCVQEVAEWVRQEPSFLGLLTASLESTIRNAKVVADWGRKVHGAESDLVAAGANHDLAIAVAGVLAHAKEELAKHTALLAADEANVVMLMDLLLLPLMASVQPRNTLAPQLQSLLQHVFRVLSRSQLQQFPAKALRTPVAAMLKAAANTDPTGPNARLAVIAMLHLLKLFKDVPAVGQAQRMQWLGLDLDMKLAVLEAVEMARDAGRTVEAAGLDLDTFDDADVAAGFEDPNGYDRLSAKFLYGPLSAENRKRRVQALLAYISSFRFAAAARAARSTDTRNPLLFRYKNLLYYATQPLLMEGGARRMDVNLVTALARGLAAASAPLADVMCGPATGDRDGARQALWSNRHIMDALVAARAAKGDRVRLLAPLQEMVAALERAVACGTGLSPTIVEPLRHVVDAIMTEHRRAVAARNARTAAVGAIGQRGQEYLAHRFGGPQAATLAAVAARRKATDDARHAARLEVATRFRAEDPQGLRALKAAATAERFALEAAAAAALEPGGGAASAASGPPDTTAAADDLDDAFLDSMAGMGMGAGSAAGL
jgi:hypothetical protein